MDEFIKKLIERLEEKEKILIDNAGDIGCTIGIVNAMECSKEIANELAEECKEECNLQSDKILFAYSDLLRRFRQAEESCIWEVSGSIENDIKELEEECEQLLDGFNALLYSSDEYDNDFCEWEMYKTNAILRHKNCMFSEDTIYPWKFNFCPYCGKKIKVVSAERPDSTKEAWKQQIISRFERVE